MAPRTARIVGIVLALALVLFGSWVFYRASFLGINNVFSREHVLTETRPLNDEVSLELAIKTLQADGYDLGSLTPIMVWSTPDFGNVQWVQ